MELIALGVGGSWSSRGGGTSGYLLRAEGFNLVVDLGSGTLGRLQQVVPVSEVHAVIVSHAHPDHFVDLYPLFYARFYGELGEAGLPLHAPTGLFDLAAALVSRESREGMAVAFDVQAFSPGERFEVGPFRVRSAQMEHLGIPAAGFRLEADGAVLAYSGDTGPTPALVRLAADADVLLSEATWQEGDDLKPFHLSARQAGAHARQAGAGRLVLTHIWPTHDPERSREEAAEAFDGPIDVAVEGMRLEI
ncbi:MAG TPA: MBL fold metallo-hydrolase [Actinomycetota bacterium]|nr:MBL fold metallo-hydrolase [Actinomycetota bacterium]